MTLAENVPTGTCIVAIKDEMYLVFMFPAIVALIAGLMSGIALPVQYLLWKSYPELKRLN